MNREIEYKKSDASLSVSKINIVIEWIQSLDPPNYWLDMDIISSIVIELDSTMVQFVAKVSLMRISISFSKTFFFSKS